MEIMQCVLLYYLNISVRKMSKKKYKPECQWLISALADSSDGNQDLHAFILVSVLNCGTFWYNCCLGKFCWHFFFIYSCLRVGHGDKRFHAPHTMLAAVYHYNDTLCVQGYCRGSGTLLCHHWWKLKVVFEKLLSLSNDLTSKTST